LESGELGTVASITNEMSAILKDYYAGRVFTSLANVWSAANTPANYVAVANLNAATLRTGLDAVRYRRGSVRAVVGTRLALAPITQFANFANDPTAGNWGNADAISEIYKTGWLGQWYGAPIIALDQIWNNPIANATMIPNNYVLILSEDAGEFITYGDVKWKQYDDMRPTPPDWFGNLSSTSALID
jgi:hypothetical protein